MPKVTAFVTLPLHQNKVKVDKNKVSEYNVLFKLSSEHEF